MGKTLWIVGAIVILGVIGFFIFNSSFEETGGITNDFFGNNEKNLQKQECPYECCSEGTYYEKTCLLDYQCISNSCQPIDSDGDNLKDIEEKQIGTNPNSFDTDGDTLGDYQEYKILGTNPLNKNTDKDRYGDANDADPLTKNSADIKFTLLNQQGDYNYFNLVADGIVIGSAATALSACTAGTLGACAAAAPGVWGILNPILDDVIYTQTFNILISNVGNDYSSYLNYEVVYKIGNEELKRVQYNYGRIDANIQVTVPYSQDILLSDIAYGRTWDLIFGQQKITIQIENLDYERF